MTIGVKNLNFSDLEWLSEKMTSVEDVTPVIEALYSNESNTDFHESVEKALLSIMLAFKITNDTNYSITDLIDMAADEDSENFKALFENMKIEIHFIMNIYKTIRMYSRREIKNAAISLNLKIHQLI